MIGSPPATGTPTMTTGTTVDPSTSIGKMTSPTFFGLYTIFLLGSNKRGDFSFCVFVDEEKTRKIITCLLI